MARWHRCRTFSMLPRGRKAQRNEMPPSGVSASGAAWLGLGLGLGMGLGLGLGLGVRG